MLSISATLQSCRSSEFAIALGIIQNSGSGYSNPKLGVSKERDETAVRSESERVRPPISIRMTFRNS